MILQILSILKNDEALKQLLGASESDSRIYPFSAPLKDKCIVYTFSPVTDDKILRQDRLEVRTIAKDLETATAIESRVRALLLTLGDTAIQIGLNGGGTLEDMKTGTYHLISTFICKYRSI
jgi:hypothetical protein